MNQIPFSPGQCLSAPSRPPASQKIQLDYGTKLDQKAERVVKLVNSMLAKGQCEGVLSFDLTEGMDGPGSWKAQAVIHLDKKYTVLVYKEANRKPRMTITIEPGKIWDGAIIITDLELNGQVNSGFLPASLNPAKRKDTLKFSDESATPWGAAKKDRETMAKDRKNQPIFQEYYEDAVRKLLKFYESK